jgi:hypothetical protein
VFVTVTPQDLIADPSIVRVPAWAVPDTDPSGAAISQALEDLNAGSRPTGALLQEFRQLKRGADYSPLATADTVAVGFGLATPVPAFEQRTIAVRYRNDFNEAIGGSFADTLVLEMIKPADPRPDGPPPSTWPLMMRNAYDLGFGDIDPATLTIKIKDLLSVQETSKPQGSDVPYVQIFGLDRDGAPDGKIDHVFLGWFDDLNRGILWFPVLDAFAPPADRVNSWTGGAFEFSGVYLPQFEKSSRIYSDLLNPTQEADVHQYIIEATVTTPAP